MGEERSLSRSFFLREEPARRILVKRLANKYKKLAPPSVVRNQPIATLLHTFSRSSRRPHALALNFDCSLDCLCQL